MRYPIRVLHVLGGLNRGGAETMVMNLYRNIDRGKVQFDFIVHTENKCDYDEEIKSLGGRIYNIPRYTGKNHLQYKRAWSRFFEEHPEYKLIHGHVRSTAAIYLKIAGKHGLITISHSHNTSSGEGLSAVVKNILQYPIRYTSDYLFACSERAGEWLYGKKACEKENFYILNNSIDTKKFIYDEKKRMEKRKELQIEDKFVIGHVGRFHHQKNHKFLIDIFKAVHDKNDRAVLLLIGDGELRKMVEKRVNDLGLENSVVLTGVRSDIPELLQAMDIFVLPSLYEGLGIVTIEAQAAGLPCIVADTVPKEAFITDLIEKCPLSEGAEMWAKVVLQYTNHRKRNTFNEIKNANFDILEQTKEIEDFYQNIFKQ